MHGTAFLISNDGLMLTNVHNVKSCLDAHGLATTGYDGANGDLECAKLTLKDSDDRTLGAIKLVASYPYHVATGHRVEVAVVRSTAPEVLAEQPLQLSRAVQPGFDLHSVGYAGKTSRSIRAIAKQIRSLNKVIRHFISLDSEMAAVDPGRMPTLDIFAIYFKFLQSSVPLVTESNLLSGVIVPSELVAWMSLKPEEAKSKLVDLSRQAQLQVYAYIKMLEGLKSIQYRRGYVRSYPDADNSLKSSQASLKSERWPGVWILRGDARPGSSGSPVVDAHGEVNGIVFATGLIANDVRSGCTLDVMFSDWESENYASCRNVGFLMVDSHFIRQALDSWGIVVP
ncbi:MAG: hypothetical protein IPJ84_08555 [Bdellovibrionales bacterium]|nr:hypothetical protein [Bdellovibrionales bacterium]